jgi:hypothetical protein
VNGTTLFGTVELPEDNTPGGRQNAAILEVESRGHEAVADQSVTAYNLPMNTISTTAAFESTSQPANYISKKCKTASTASTFHEALTMTAARMTPNPHLHSTTPKATTAPRPRQHPDTHDYGNHRRKRSADAEWEVEEAMAKSRRLNAPVPTLPAPRPRNAFDEGEKFLAAHKAAARRRTERRLRENLS